jgi:hypothetical protein
VTWATVVAAIIVAAGSVWTARIAKKTQADGAERRLMRRQIEDLQADMLTLKAFVYKQRAQLADLGVKAPPPPPRLRSEEWE